MLPKAHRLVKDEDFKKLAHKGRAFFGKLLNLKVLPNKEKISRFGVVVSTKVDKRATARNKLQRKIREVLRLNLQSLASGYDVMVIGKKEALEADYQSLEKELLSLLGKAKLYTNDTRNT